MKRYYVIAGHNVEYMIVYAAIISLENENGDYKYEYFIRSATDEIKPNARLVAVRAAIFDALGLVTKLKSNTSIASSGVHQFSRLELAKYDANLLLEYHVQKVIYEHSDRTGGSDENV